MSRNLLWTIARLRLATEQPHRGNLVAGVHVPVPEEGQMPDPNPSKVMTRFPWASLRFDMSEQPLHFKAFLHEPKHWEGA